jgi:ankyrin repeat protein
MEALLKAGCDPNVTDSSGQSIFVLASRLGRLSMLDLLLRHGVYADPAAVIAAASNGQAKTLEFLIQQGVPARGVSLHWLAKDGTGQMIEILAGARVDINGRDEYGNTPLILAAGYRNYEAVETLLRLRADPNARNHDGITPLLAAAGDWQFPSARWYAGARDFTGIAEMLLLFHAKPGDCEFKTGKSALSIAVSKRDYFSVKLLRESGATAAITAENAIDPLQLARSQRFAEILHLFEN